MAAGLVDLPQQIQRFPLSLPVPVFHLAQFLIMPLLASCIWVVSLMGMLWLGGNGNFGCVGAAGCVQQAENVHEG